VLLLVCECAGIVHLIHTRTHARTHTHTHTRTRTRTHTRSLSLSLSLSHTHALSLSLSLSHTHTHTLTHSHTGGWHVIISVGALVGGGNGERARGYRDWYAQRKKKKKKKEAWTKSSRVSKLVCEKAIVMSQNTRV